MESKNLADIFVETIDSRILALKELGHVVEAKYFWVQENWTGFDCYVETCGSHVSRGFVAKMKDESYVGYCHMSHSFYVSQQPNRQQICIDTK